MSRMFDPSAEDPTSIARNLIMNANEKLEAGDYAGACKLAREAAVSALKVLADLLNVWVRSHEHESLAGILNRLSQKARVPADIVRAVHILDPHLYGAVRHGADGEADLAGHVNECIEAAQRVVEWAARLFSRGGGLRLAFELPISFT